MSYPLVLNLPISINFRLTFVLKIFWLFTFILIIFLLFFSVFQINALTAENNFLNKQEKRLAELKKEAEILKINFAKVNSLANIETYFQNQNFKKTEKIKYIRILETSIAELPVAKQ